MTKQTKGASKPQAAEPCHSPIGDLRNQMIKMVKIVLRSMDMILTSHGYLKDNGTIAPAIPYNAQFVNCHAIHLENLSNFDLPNEKNAELLVTIDAQIHKGMSSITSSSQQHKSKNWAKLKSWTPQCIFLYPQEDFATCCH